MKKNWSAEVFRESRTILCYVEPIKAKEDIWGVQNFLPDRLTSETEDTIAKHMEILNWSFYHIC